MINNFLYGVCGSTDLEKWPQRREACLKETEAKEPSTHECNQAFNHTSPNIGIPFD